MTLKASEDREDSQNLWKQHEQRDTEMVEVTNNNQCDQCLKKVSESQEHSTKSWRGADTAIMAQGCSAIKQGMVIVSSWVFILKMIQWHIHAGSWSLVNCWREGSYEALYKVLMNINECSC